MAEIPCFLLDALQFQNARREMLRRVSDREWKRILSDWHVVRLTFPLRELCADELPTWVCEHIDAFRADNSLRFERIKNVYSSAAKVFEGAGIDHVVIKGFSLWPGYTTHPRYRPQSDIDIYCPAETISRARNALVSLGYATQPHLGRVSTEHLFALGPPDSWVWHGNHFDPDMPISIELHFSFWDSENSHIPLQGVGEFWSRRARRMLDEIWFPALKPVDNLGYTAINLLRHLLNNLPATEQVYSLARFLHTHADDRTFWREWQDLHDDSLRRLEAISFRLASEWFACQLSPEVSEEIDRLVPDVQAWFRYFSKSTRSTWFQATKGGMWLHLGLLKSKRDKSVVFLHRIAPLRARARFLALCDEVEAQNRINENLFSRVFHTGRRLRDYATWFIARSSYHLAALPLALWRGLGYQLAQASRSTVGTGADNHYQAKHFQ
jgi:Uncharacterised nucleotidyltransferase